MHHYTDIPCDDDNVKMMANSLQIVIKEEKAPSESEIPMDVQADVVDFRLVPLPKDWHMLELWGEIHFTKFVRSNAGSVVLQKTLKIAGDINVGYFEKTESVKPLHLAHSSSRVQELTDIIKYFDLAELCPGCSEEELKVLDFDSTTLGTRNTHCWRSNECSRIIVPEEKKCSTC